MRELARIRDFRFLFVGLLASAVGDLLLTMMLAVWVAKLTGSDAAAGITFGFELIAYAVSPLIAWPADRFRRRPLAITANVATAAILIPLLTVHHVGRVWVIYAVAVAYGTASVIAAAASRGLMGLIVPAASTPDAYGALQTAQQTLRVVAPVLGVALYTRLGPSVVVVMTVVSLLASAAAIAVIRAPETRPERTEQHWLSEMTVGVRHLATDRVLSRITIGNSATMMAAGAFAVLGFAVVTEGLHRPAGFLTVLVSVQALTAIVAATLSARIVRRLGEIAATGVAFALGGAGMVMTVFPSLPVVIAAYALAGLAVPLGGVSAYSALQRRTPAPVFARTAIAFTSAVGFPQVISIPAAAALLAFAGFRPLVLICFAIVMLIAAYMWRGRALTRPGPEVTLEAPSPEAPSPEAPSPEVPSPAAPLPAEAPSLRPLPAEAPWLRPLPAEAPSLRPLARMRSPALVVHRASHQLDIGQVRVGGANRVSRGTTRAFDDQPEVIAAVRASVPNWIGVNHGSPDNRRPAHYGRPTAVALMKPTLIEPALIEPALIEPTLCECSLFEDRGLSDIRCSARHHDPMVHDPMTMIRAYRRRGEPRDHSLELAVAVACPAFYRTVGSPIAFGAPPAGRFGDTIRVPRPASPAGKVEAGIAALESLGLRGPGLEIVPCPSCGGAQVGAYALAGPGARALR
jgi:hypothetical protein